MESIFPTFRMPACSRHFFVGHKRRCRACDEETERQFREVAEAWWRSRAEEEEDSVEYDVAPRPRYRWVIHTECYAGCDSCDNPDHGRQLLVWGVGYPEQMRTWCLMAKEAALAHGVNVSRATWWVEPPVEVSV